MVLACIEESLVIHAEVALAAARRYKWAQVMSLDGFAAFEEIGLNNTDAIAAEGLKYRNTILADGGGRAPLLVFEVRTTHATLHAVCSARGLRWHIRACMHAGPCQASDALPAGLPGPAAVYEGSPAGREPAASQGSRHCRCCSAVLGPVARHAGHVSTNCTADWRSQVVCANECVS